MVNPPSTIDTHEINKFSDSSRHWWDEKGPFKPLHQLNPLRIEFIRDHARKHLKLPETGVKGAKILDVGCGGGILTEPLCRLGGIMTGLDASAHAIEVAKAHAQAQNLEIEYINAFPENFNPGYPYDIITALEIVEHVADLESFMRIIASHLKPHGLFFFSTLNRTLKSFALGKVMAEYILRLVPAGTHEWKKFAKPSEIDILLRKNGLSLLSLVGVTLNPLRREWVLTPNLDVNYMGVAIKREGKL